MLKKMNSPIARLSLCLATVGALLVCMAWTAELSGINPHAAAMAQGTSNGSDSQSQTQTGPSGGDAEAIMGVNTAGTVRVNNLANLEALLNIIANSVEIMGIANVGSFFIGAIIAFVCKRPILGAILLVLCPVSITVGLATPGVINWVVASARDAQVLDSTTSFMIAIPLVLSLALAAIAIGFIPAILAFRSRHQYRWAIFGATFVSWLVPFGWPALLFWAVYKSKDDGGNPAGGTPA